MIQEQSEECIKRNKNCSEPWCSTGLVLFKNNNKTEKELTHMCNLNCVLFCTHVEKCTEIITRLLTLYLREIGLRPG